MYLVVSYGGGDKLWKIAFHVNGSLGDASGRLGSGEVWLCFGARWYDCTYFWDAEGNFFNFKNFRFTENIFFESLNCLFNISFPQKKTLFYNLNKKKGFH